MSSKEEAAFEFNDKGFKNVLKALKGSIEIKIGVLGDKNSRTSNKENKTNAGILKKHEYGEWTVIDGFVWKLPERSVLRVPLAEQLYSYCKKADLFDKTLQKDLVKHGSLMQLGRWIAVTSERVVDDAFETGGFGKWQPSNMNYKKVHQTLVETRQLQRSITSSVEETDG